MFGAIAMSLAVLQQVLCSSEWFSGGPALSVNGPFGLHICKQDFISVISMCHYIFNKNLGACEMVQFMVLGKEKSALYKVM